MTHSNISGGWIGGDQSKVNASRSLEVVTDECLRSSSVKKSSESDQSVNCEMISKYEGQRHLCVDNCKHSNVTSYLSRQSVSDDILIDINEQFKGQKVINDTPKTPKLSKIDQLKLNFEGSAKKKFDFETEKPGNSPGLLRYMQYNDKKLSENLKVKQAKSSIKKLKKQEKEAKSAKKENSRKKFIEIQQMFDRMSRKNASESQVLESQGGLSTNMGKGGSSRGPQKKCPIKPKLEDFD